MSKKDKKAAKKKAKAEKQRIKKYAGICPKCKHAAHEHRFVQRYSLFQIGPTPTSGACEARIEKPGDDGFLRIEDCDCNLTPDEAQLNSEKASGLKSFDALMSTLNKSKG